MKKLALKKILTKKDKELSILLGLVELYIKTGSAIGSNSLKETSFDNMSSATIRNYFVKLEKQGYLAQQHSSGGRIPTIQAFKLYADKVNKKILLEKKEEKTLKEKLSNIDKKVTDYLNKSAELLSELTNCSIFQSSPRFDQDLINDVKLICIDTNKILYVLITDFGLIKTDTLYVNNKIDEKTLKLIEDFFLFRMNKKQEPQFPSQKDKKLAQQLYNEVMVRYVVGYSSMHIEDIYKTGLSKLLNYDEFQDPLNLAESLSIFEDPEQMKNILQNAIKQNSLSYFIADDLEQFDIISNNCSIISVPYKVNDISIGAIAVLCPMRISYKKVFAILNTYAKHLSETLTKNIYKYKISFRDLEEYKKLKEYNKSILLEDKTQTVK